MAKKDKYLVGLDIGSTKTCILIAEIDEQQVKFLALGAAESKGLRKGLIVNLDSTVSSIRRAVEEAESVANVPVDSAVVGVAGSHVRGVNSRAGETVLRVIVTERMHPGVVYTTFHFPETGANLVTTENSDWATNCPEYKVTAVQVAKVSQPAEWVRAQRESRPAHRHDGVPVEVTGESR